MAGEQGFEGPVILDEDESLTRALGAHDYGHLRFGFRPDRPLPRTDRRSVRDRLSTGSTKKTISQGSAGRPPDPQADPIHRLVGSGMRVGRSPRQKIPSNRHGLITTGSPAFWKPTAWNATAKAESDLLDWSTMTRPRKMPA